RNQLQDMPPEVGQLINLERLYIDDDHLSILPTELINLSNLGTLVIYGSDNLELSSEIEQLLD
ncbi:MAG: hypothetical protein AAF485_17335, partial [Chloroflexota bacterium]